MALLKNTSIDDSGFLQLPSGTTGQRPTPQAGQVRYNSTIGKIEFYNSVASEWIENRYSGVVADGGIVYDTDSNGTSYRVHVFTTVGSSTFSAKSSGEVEYLIVAGGGGGSGNFYDDGGGGGGGGLITGTVDVSPQDYTITVGGGGGQGGSGGTGGNSSAFGLTALGGGGGGSHRSPGNSGGSGGGGLGSFASDNRDVSGGSATQPSSSSGGFGNPGGTGGLYGVTVNGGGYPLSGGGGGAGSIGNFPDAVLSIGGAGGYGLNTNISGISTFYAGGGGGVRSGRGGLGGGADASYGRGGSPALIGIPNSGGGGGGGRLSDGAALGYPSPGGSGVVIIRYPLHKVPATSAPKVLNDGLVLDFDLGKASTFKNINESVTDSRKKYTATVVTPVFHGAGSHRNSVVMNGSTGYIDLGSDETIKTGSDWTVETWFKFDVVPDAYNNNTSPGNFIGDESIAENSWYWSVLERKLALWNRSPGYWRYGSTEIQPNTWYQSVLVSYPGGTSYRMFLNGTPEDGDHVNQVWNAAYSGLRVRYIGRGSSGNPRTFDGNIAISRIYNQALTNQQIEDNFNATRWRFGI